MNELSDLKERSGVLCDPPAFRLDVDQIGAGLFTNFHRISSNFPLERRTSARKKSRKIHFSQSDLKPIFAAIGLVVRFDWLSGGDLSFN